MTRATPKSKRKKGAGAHRDRAARTLFVCAWTLTGLALLGVFERYLWLGALVRELGFHLSLLALLTAGIALARRAWVPMASLGGLALLFAVPLAPLYRPTRPTPEAGPLLRVASAHLSEAELSASSLHSWLARTHPEAVALTGLRNTRDFEERFGSYSVVRGRAELRALLLVHSALAPTAVEDGQFASSVVRVGRCPLRLLTLELPKLAAYTALDARARAIARFRKPPRSVRSVWLGQLGSRPEAHDLAALLEQHALRDGRNGHGRFATAPGSFGNFGFPLSHLLVHGWIRVRELAVEAPLAVGAQRTLRATIELTEPRCRAERDLHHE